MPSIKRFFKRQKLDFQMLVTNSQLEVSRKEYCLIRNYIFICIHFGNGPWSGVTSNFILTEFAAVVWNEEHQIFSFGVEVHKTDRGCSNIFVSQRKQLAQRVY